VVGLIVLLGYFVPVAGLVELRLLFLQWAVIVAAVALLVGVANLLHVHWRRVVDRQTGGGYSLLVIISLVATLIVAVGSAWWGPGGAASPAMQWIFNYIQLPVEASLMAILAIVLAYTLAGMLRRRMNLFSIIFISTVLLVLVGTISLPYVQVPELVALRDFISQVLAAGGGRGLLFGIALGTIATGLRVLMGGDRPYGG
jgi:hypothetical protein